MYSDCKQSVGQWVYNDLGVTKVTANSSDPVIPIVFVPDNVHVVVANVSFLLVEAISHCKASYDPCRHTFFSCFGSSASVGILVTSWNIISSVEEQ